MDWSKIYRIVFVLENQRKRRDNGVTRARVLEEIFKKIKKATCKHCDCVNRKSKSSCVHLLLWE